MDVATGTPVWVRRWTYVMSAVLISIGVFGRIIVLTGPVGRLNADEAVAGLMARSLLDGQWTPFYWGQHYGGTVELLVLAPAIALIGNAAMWVIPLIESVIIAALVYRLTADVRPGPDALLAAALSWSVTSVWIWFSTRPMLFYQPVIIAGLIVLVLSHPARQQRRWSLIGVVAGIGWWTSPQILFFAIPAAAVVLTYRPTRREWAHLVVGGVLGASPWLISNLGNGVASLRQGPPPSGSIADHVEQQLSTGWPMILGLRIPFDERWLTPPLLAGVAMALLVAGAITAIVRFGWRQTGIITTIVSFAVLQAFAPTGSYVGSGRYYVFVIPAIAVIVVVATAGSSALHNSLRTGFVAVLAALTVIGIAETRDRRMEPTGVAEVAERLASEGHRYVIADYWSSYLLAWYEPSLIVSPTHTDRRPDWSQAVSEADQVVAVVWNGDPNDASRLTDLLDPSGPARTVEQWDDWTVVVIDQQTQP